MFLAISSPYHQAHWTSRDRKSVFYRLERGTLRHRADGVWLYEKGSADEQQRSPTFCQSTRKKCASRPNHPPTSRQHVMVSADVERRSPTSKVGNLDAWRRFLTGENLKSPGWCNMRKRASQIEGKLDIYTAAGHGTTIVLTVPIPS